MQMGRQRRAAGQNERGQRRQFFDDRVDLALQPFHLGLGNAQRALSLAALVGRGQVGAQVEQVVLDAGQRGAQIALRRKPRHPDGAVGFVHRADGGDARMGLGDTAAVGEPGLAGIAAFCVDFIELYHWEIRPCRANPNLYDPARRAFLGPFHACRCPRNR